MIAVAADCKKHPKYQAVRRPEVDCKGCWAVFELMMAARKTRSRVDRWPWGINARIELENRGEL